MNCYEFESHLSGFVDGDMSSSIRKEFLNHKSECTHCQQLLQDFKYTIRAVRGLPRHATSPDFERRLRERIASGKKQPWFQWLRNIGPVPKYIVATAFAVIVVLVGYQLISQHAQPMESHQQAVIPPPALNMQEDEGVPVAEETAEQPSMMQSDTYDTNQFVPPPPEHSYERQIKYVNGE